MIKTWDGQDLEFKFNHVAQHVDGHLIALPAVIDPHVHFRTPGLTHKEDWQTGAKVALRGGCTTVFDMPNTLPPTITQERLLEKQKIIQQQLALAKLPLRYQLFFGADKHHLDEIHKAKQFSIGIKVFMGCSTGNLLMDDDESLHAVFEIAAHQDMLVAVHAEDEALIRERQKQFAGAINQSNYAVHSKIRNIEVATRAVEKAIALSQRYGTQLYILHVSSAEEIELIKSAKQQKLNVYAETTPHHLFFDDSFYEAQAGRAQVNPPLREAKHQAALFAAIDEGVIDTIGSDHAPHTIAEKAQSYGACPSGMPGLEFMLPMLLNAHHQGRISLNKIVSLTSTRAREIFKLPHYQDWVIADLALAKTIGHHDTRSKCGYTPYAGLTLTGWPLYTILADEVFDLRSL